MASLEHRQVRINRENLSNADNKLTFAVKVCADDYRLCLLSKDWRQIISFLQVVYLGAPNQMTS